MGRIELVFGTSNPAKIAQVQGALDPLGVAVRGVGELGIRLHVPEDGTTAQQNARTKALAYAQAANRTVFSMDNALYLQGLSPKDQPGPHVRRIPGSAERPADAEVLSYYLGLICRHGSSMIGYWDFAVAIASRDGRLAETIIRSPRQFVSKATDRVVDGYPLESIQIDPDSGKYVADMSEAEQAEFWQRAIGAPLMWFVRSNVDMLAV
jgi:inosine/xanthosine triphosphate pyrophosphatase family protein